MAALKNGVCAVLCAGKVEDYDLLKTRLEQCEFLICADAGYLHAQKCGIKPDVIMGDFDSAEQPESDNVLTFPIRKDETDAWLACEHAHSLGFTKIRLLAATGGRLDHTYANAVLCSAMAAKGIEVVLLDEKNKLFCLTHGKHMLEAEGYTKLSMFAFGGDVCGLCTSGVSYPLKDYTLSSHSALGVSNFFVEETAAVSFKNGTLMIIQAND